MAKQINETIVNCPRDCGNRAIVDALFGILPCATCISEDNTKRGITQAPEFLSLSKQTRIQNQRDTFEKDMLLPYTAKGEVSEEFRRADPERAKLADDDLAMIKG